MGQNVSFELIAMNTQQTHTSRKMDTMHHLAPLVRTLMRRRDGETAETPPSIEWAPNSLSLSLYPLSLLQVWGPGMYVARFPLQSLVKSRRIKPGTQHAVFGALVLGALAHGTWVLSEESSM